MTSHTRKRVCAVAAAALLTVLPTTLLSGCAEDAKPVTALASGLRTPIHPGDSLYPAETSALAEVKALTPLHPEVPLLVTAKGGATLITLAGLMPIWEKREEPYDRIVQAASDWAFGIPFASLEEISAAGLDLSQPLGVAWLDRDIDLRAIFVALADADKFKAAFGALAKKKRREVEESTQLGSTMLRMVKGRRKDSVVVLREGYAYFVNVDAGDSRHKRSWKAAKAIARRAPEEGLAADPAFKRSVAGLQFGAHLAVYAPAAPWIDAELKRIDDGREHYLSRNRSMQEWLDSYASKDGKQDDDSIKERRERMHVQIKAHTLLIASLDREREDVMASKEHLGGLAVGFEATSTTLRYKAYLDTGGKTPPLQPIGASADGRAAGGNEANAGGANAWWTRGAAPAAELRVSVGAAWRRLALLKALDRLGVGDPILDYGGDGLDWDKHLAPHVDGTVGLRTVKLARKDRSGRRHAELLSIGLVDPEKARASLSKLWQDAQAAPEDSAMRQVIRDDKEHEKVDWLLPAHDLCIAIEGNQLLVSRSREVVIAERKRLSGSEVSWLAEERDPAVASLALFHGEADALWLLPARTPQTRTPPKRGFGNAGIFGKAGIDSMLFRTPKKGSKTERLVKKRDKLRGERSGLRRRQEIAQRTGKKRLITAVGSGIVWGRSQATGVAFYGAQRLGEPNVAALAEWASWYFVDSSSRSETAIEIAKLDKRIRALDKALEDDFEAELGGIFSGLGDAGQLGGLVGSDLNSSMIGTAGGFGLSGIGEGGGGTGEGIGVLGGRGGGGRVGGLGGLGTKGLGGPASGDTDANKPKKP